jgi:multiple sugar transport system ATP-binding protein
VEPSEATLTLEVAVVESTGSLTYVTTSGEAGLTIVVTGRSDLRAGDRIGLAIAPRQVHLFDAESGLAV